MLRFSMAHLWKHVRAGHQDDLADCINLRVTHTKLGKVLEGPGRSRVKALVLRMFEVAGICWDCLVIFSTACEDIKYDRPNCTGKGAA